MKYPPPRYLVEVGVNWFIPVRKGNSTGAAAPLPCLLWLNQPLIKPIMLTSSTTSTDLPDLGNSPGFSPSPF